MSNWLEEAESNNKSQNDRQISQEKIHQKVDAISQNYEANKQTYDAFIKELRNLVERVNNLPLEHRKEFGKLKIYTKESKLNNELYYLTSSRGVKKRVYRGLFSLFSKSSFKNIRVAYFTVSRQMGMVNIELKDNLLLKMRMSLNGNNDRAMSMKKKDWGRKNELYLLKMELLQNDLAMEIIDWLSFKKEMGNMSFSAEK